MKKHLFVFVALFFFTTVFSQNGFVKITNEESGKTVLLKEKSRIRIKTFDGKRISGRFQIINDSTMLLKKKEISLVNIKKIKRNPLAMTIATDVVLFYTGAIVIGVLAISEATAAAAIVGGGGTALAMILGPNFLKGYSADKYKVEFVDD